MPMNCNCRSYVYFIHFYLYIFPLEYIVSSQSDSKTEQIHLTKLFELNHDY
jgi:hypothetical protein